MLRTPQFPGVPQDQLAAPVATEAGGEESVLTDPDHLEEEEGVSVTRSQLGGQPVLLQLREWPDPSPLDCVQRCFRRGALAQAQSHNFTFFKVSIIYQLSG